MLAKHDAIVTDQSGLTRKVMAGQTVPGELEGLYRSAVAEAKSESEPEVSKPVETPDVDKSVKAPEVDKAVKGPEVDKAVKAPDTSKTPRRKS